MTWTLQFTTENHLYQKFFNFRAHYPRRTTPQTLRLVDHRYLTMALLLHSEVFLVAEKELMDLESNVPVRLCSKKVCFYVTDLTQSKTA